MILQKLNKHKMLITTIIIFVVFFIFFSSKIEAAGNVSDAIEKTWSKAETQIKDVVNNVIFPALSLVLTVFFFVKLGSAYFDYRKHGQFEWAAPTILFICLIFTLTAPLYIWSIL